MNDMAIFEKQINSDNFTNQLRNYVLDESVVRKVKQMAITELRKKPDLLACTPESIIGSVLECVQLGLSLDSNLGHAALIKFNKNMGDYRNPNWVSKCQLMPMYRGYIYLGFKTGLISSVDSYVTKEKDTEFKYKIVDGIVLLSHEPALKDRGGLTGAYVVINFKDGARKIVFMDVDEIEKCRKSSKTKGTDENGKKIETIWDKFTEEMYKKTVIRRAFKQVDISPQLSAAVTMDELCEAELDQNNGSMLDVDDFKEVKDVATSSISEKIEVPDVLFAKFDHGEKDHAEKEEVNWLKEQEERKRILKEEDERLGNIETIQNMWESMNTTKDKIEIFLVKYNIKSIEDMSLDLSRNVFKNVDKKFQEFVKKQEEKGIIFK